MKKLSLLKVLKLFREYKKVLKLNSNELQQVFGSRIDDAFRIYNVLNIPEEMIGEPYNLRKLDIDKFAESMIRDYSIRISEYLNSKGLNEMFDFYEVKKVEKYSYLVVIGFSLPKNSFRSNKYFDNIRFKIIPAISILILIAVSLILVF